MARVEWAALSGDEVEAVTTNLLYNDHPTSIRIRPSQGDFGIDLAVPRDTDAKVWDIYQIKKFAVNLTDGQKQQIEKSLQRLMIGLVRRGIPVGDWYLVMPLDPTLDNLLDWFRGMPDDAIAKLFSNEKLAITDEEKEKITGWRNTPGRRIEWKGLHFCEALVAKYWYVPDYYLHGGSERIRAAVADVASILRRDLSLPSGDSGAPTSILQPGDVREHLLRLQTVLDGDPHYRYGLSLDPRRLT